MTTTVTRIYSFEAAHQLPAQFGGPATAIHGHTYTVRVEMVRGTPTEDLDRVWRSVLRDLDHRLLNDTFEDTTVEGIAEALLERLDFPPVLAVEVQEGNLRFARAVR